MSKRDTHLTQSGEVVQQILDRVENLTTATPETDGLMSKYDKEALDNIADDRPLTNLEIEAILNS